MKTSTGRSGTAPARAGAKLTIAVLMGSAFALCGMLWASTAGAQGLESALEASFESSCARGRGVVAVELTNTSTAPLTAIVEVGPVERALVVGPGAQESVRITGRPNGAIPVMLNDASLGEASIDCEVEIGPDFGDQLADAALRRWFNPIGDSLVVNLSSERRGAQDDAPRSIEPGEPTDCVLDGGSVWAKVTPQSDAIDIAPEANSQVAVFQSTVANPTFADLMPYACVEASASTTIATVPGEVLFVQLTGAGRIAASIQTERVPAAGIEVVDYSHRCISSGGVIEVTVRNVGESVTSTVLQAVQVEARQWLFPSRQLMLEGGESATAQVSSRRDGLYRLHVNGDATGHLVWVGCDATAPNDTIETAAEVIFEDDAAVARFPAPGESYSYTAEEIERFGDGQDRCGPISASVASAWFTFVPEHPRLTFDGSDDQDIAIWRSTTDAPSTLADLEPVWCGDPEIRTAIDVVPGERYWMSANDETNSVYFVAAPVPVNDDLAGALPLDSLRTVDVRGATEEPGEDTSCAWGRTAWFTWTADRENLDAEPIETLLSGFSGFRSDRHLDYAIWSSDVADPTFSDLTMADCSRRNDFGETPLVIGTTYWLQMRVSSIGTLAVAPDGALIDVQVQVVCGAAGAATVQWMIANPHSVPVDLVVSLSDANQRIERSVTAPASDVVTVRMSGRDDGLYFTSVDGAPAAISTQEQPYRSAPVDVRCEDHEAPVEVVHSCLVGRGRIDVFVTTTEAGLRFANIVVIGRSTLIERSTGAYEDRITRTTITGRRNGEYIVEVDARGADPMTFNITIDCENPEE